MKRTVKRGFYTGIIMGCKEGFHRYLKKELIAHEADLHRAYIGQIERGEKNIGVQNLDVIAKALKIKPGDLLND